MHAEGNARLTINLVTLTFFIYTITHSRLIASFLMQFNSKDQYYERIPTSFAQPNSQIPVLL